MGIFPSDLHVSIPHKVCRQEELRQSQVRGGSAGPATPPEGGCGDVSARTTEVRQQSEREVDMLRTEVEGLTMELEHTKADAERVRDQVKQELGVLQASLRAAEIERDEMHVQYLDAMKQGEALLEDKIQLKVPLLRALFVVWHGLLATVHTALHGPRLI